MSSFSFKVLLSWAESPILRIKIIAIIKEFVILFIIFPQRGSWMKPVVLLAMVKDLQIYIKDIKDLDKNNLVEINKKLIKISSEVNENLEKI